MINKTNSPIYWTLLKHENWNLHIAANSQGLLYVGSPNQPFEEMTNWVNTRFMGGKSPVSNSLAGKHSDINMIRDDLHLQPYVTELIEYLQGSRETFTIPFDVHGTPFQLAVWNALCNIPYGQTMSYSEIAKQIKKPAAVRAVGTAIGANPVLITVPCHRVIGKNGALTGYRGGLEMKTKLLKLEEGSMNIEGGLQRD